MNEYKILIIGDSRVRGLQGVLDRTSLNPSFRDIMAPGAKLGDLALKTIAELSYHDSCHYNLVILVGGINNLTKLSYKPTRHAIPRFKSCGNLIDYTRREMEKAISKIKRHFNIPVALASLSGINLVNHSPHYYAELFNLQPLIDESIVALNKLIRGINQMNGLRTPDLSSDVHRCSGRGGHYRTHYTQLYDGLHPGFPLRNRWADKIISYCGWTFMELSHYQMRINTNWNPSQIYYY